MSTGGDCKIGRTRQKPEKRLKQLQTGADGLLQLILSVKSENAALLETMLHRYFANKRTTGEWFSLGETEILEFKKTCSLLEANIAELRKNNYYVIKKYGPAGFHK